MTLKLDSRRLQSSRPTARPRKRSWSVAPAATGYIRGTFTSTLDDSEQPFALWVPRSYTPKRSYPLVLVLHGTDADERMIPESCLHIHHRGFREDVILLSPLGRGDLWYEWMGETDLWEAINWVKARYRINVHRQYLTGLSMGGYACWRLACDYPEQWAAIAPVCGGGDPACAERLRHIAVWCVHGVKDPYVPVDESRRMISGLLSHNIPVRYDELPEWGHNSWEWLYDPQRPDSLIDWMLNFRLRRPAPHIVRPRRRGMFNDVFTERLIISYPATSLIPRETEILRAEAESIARFHFGDFIMRCGKLFVRSDAELTKADLAKCNHLMLGRSDNHQWLGQAKARLATRHVKGRLHVAGQTYLGKTLVAAAVQASPWNARRLLAVITYQQAQQMSGISKRLFPPEVRLGKINLYDTAQKRFIRQDI